MFRVFINYRRDDSSGYANHIFDLLSGRLGCDNVFMDVSKIQPGQEFPRAIMEAISKCDVMLVVIGPRWLNCSDGDERLGSPEDWVRREIECAFRDDLRIIPVLVQGASMPLSDLLPSTIKALASRNAFSVPDDQPTRQAVQDLIHHLERYLRERAARDFRVQCPLCGTEHAVSTSTTSFDCAACNTTVAILKPRDEIVSVGDYDTDTRRDILHRLEVASIDFENHNYSGALRAYDDLQREFPSLWEAILNKAACVFWLGREDLAHLAEVDTLLAKAEQLSNSHPSVNSFRRSIGFNLAVLGSTKERLGNGIEWSIQVLRLSQILAPNSREIDSLVSNYCDALFFEVKERLLNQLEKHRKDFDPPLTELRTLHALNELDPNPERLRFFCTICSHKIISNRTVAELPQSLARAKALLKDLTGNERFPNIAFSFFGVPRIC